MQSTAIRSKIILSVHAFHWFTPLHVEEATVTQGHWIIFFLINSKFELTGSLGNRGNLCGIRTTKINTPGITLTDHLYDATCSYRLSVRWDFLLHPNVCPNRGHAGPVVYLRGNKHYSCMVRLRVIFALNILNLLVIWHDLFNSHKKYGFKS